MIDQDSHLHPLAASRLRAAYKFALKQPTESCIPAGSLESSTLEDSFEEDLSPLTKKQRASSALSLSQQTTPAKEKKPSRVEASPPITQEALQASCGGIDLAKVEESVSLIASSVPNLAGSNKVWLKVTLLAPPEILPDVTFKSGFSAGHSVPKACFWGEDSGGTRSRITLLSPDAHMLAQSMSVHSTYYVGAVKSMSADTKWVPIGHEYTGYAGVCVILASSEALPRVFVDVSELHQFKHSVDVNVSAVVVDVGIHQENHRLRVVTLASEQLKEPGVVHACRLTLWRDLAKSFPSDVAGCKVHAFNLKLSSYQDLAQLSSTCTTHWVLSEKVKDGDSMCSLKRSYVTSSLQDPLEMSQCVPFHTFQTNPTQSYVTKAVPTSFELGSYKGCPVCKKHLVWTPREAFQYYCPKCSAGRLERDVATATLRLSENVGDGANAASLPARAFDAVADQMSVRHHKGECLNAPWIMRLRVTLGTAIVEAARLA